jgi:glutamine synthetase
MWGSELDREPQSTAGWVPSALARPPFGATATPNPFGPIGDLRLLPDVNTRAAIAADDCWTRFELVLCDLVEPDGLAAACCPRTFLRSALLELEDEIGARVLASFEHEFQLLTDTPPGPPLSLEAQRLVDPFPSRVMDALEQAGTFPERFVVERSANQFEVPIAPAEGVAAADRSVTFREVVREVARREGARATFVPVLDPEQQGNGVHVQISLVDAEGRNLLYDPNRRGNLSVLGGQFAAGVLAHACALTGLTAASPVSAPRLRPNQRGAGSSCLGLRNRETVLRIPPLVTLAGSDPAEQMRLEYRAADATANPYLALGAIVLAGLSGIRDQIPPPPLLDRDPATLDEREAAQYGVGALPSSQEDSLDALAQDAAIRESLPTLLYELYASVKQAEVDAVSGQALAELCRQYASIY